MSEFTLAWRCLVGKTLSSVRRSTPKPEFDSLLARYLRFRDVQFPLNNELASDLPLDVVREGARRLGMWRDKKPVFDTQEEVAILIDYCLYDVYRDGRNAIDRSLCDRPNRDAEEIECLLMMQRARYALLVMTEIEPAVGCYVRDLATDETRLLIDVGFGATGRKDVLVATRVLDHGEFICSSGAAFPIGVVREQEQNVWAAQLPKSTDREFDPARILRLLIASGVLSRTALRSSALDGADFNARSPLQGWRMTSEENATRQRQRAHLEARKASATKRCRCGSGKMFKNCCGRTATV